MPELIIKFDYYEDRAAYNDALNGVNYKVALQEFDSWLRSMDKSGIIPAFEEVQQYFKETIQDINLYE